MDIEGERLRCPRQQRMNVLRGEISSLFADIISSIYKGWNLLGKYKKSALAVSFLMLEAVSLFLVVFGKSRWNFLLAAFILSAFSFAMIICTIIVERTNTATRLPAEKQLRLVEVVFSVVQLIAALLAVLGVRTIDNYHASFLMLVFAIISVVFNLRMEVIDSHSSNPTIETISSSICPLDELRAIAIPLLSTNLHDLEKLSTLNLSGCSVLTNDLRRTMQEIEGHLEIDEQPVPRIFGDLFMKRIQNHLSNLEIVKTISSSICPLDELRAIEIPLLPTNLEVLELSECSSLTDDLWRIRR